MAKRKSTSLTDIARATGVTSATVSRVLNNRYEGFSVRPELRDRILLTAKELKYRPDLMAQSLRKTNMGIVGLLGINMPMVLPEHSLRGLVDILEAEGVKLTTYFATTIEQSHELPPWRIDGAVIVGAMSQPDIQPLEVAGIPYVSINGCCGRNGISVAYDDVDGTRQVMDHLIGLGHRRIAYADPSGPWVTHPSASQRRQTYLACLRKAGLKPMPMHDQQLPERPVEFVRCLIKECGATAIVAYHHYLAIAILQIVQEMGLSVPKDVSLVCFNDEYPVQWLNPQISAVSLPVREGGETAGRLLLDQMRSHQPHGRRVTLKEKLVIRRSTAAPSRRD